VHARVKVLAVGRRNGRIVRTGDDLCWCLDGWQQVSQQWQLHWIVADVAHQLKEGVAIIRRTDWDDCLRWCALDRVQPLPATPQTIALYLTDLQ